MCIRALLEEIGEPYELIPTTTDRLKSRPEEQIKINPNGWVPVLSWDDGAMYECAAHPFSSNTPFSWIRVETRAR